MKSLKNSLRLRLAVILIAIIAGIVLAGTLIYSASLGAYYTQTKIESLKDMQRYMNEIFMRDETVGDVVVQEDDVQKLRDKGYSSGIHIVVINTSMEVQFANVPDEDKTDAENPLSRLRELMFNVENADVDIRILEEDDKAQIYSYSNNDTTNKYIDMWGELESGYYFIMRIDNESINEMVSIVNRYYLQLSIGMAVVGVAAMAFVASQITKPIRNLAALSKKMSNLEFDVRYMGEAKDEIGVLGQNMNEMSAKLEETISELKTANNELLKDIEEKNEIDNLRKEFIANVSHELKTPIALIQGYAEGLKESVNEDDDSREFYCDVIVDEALRMNRMVKKLLTLNQIEFGNIQPEFERFDIIQTIDNILNQTQILIAEKGIGVDFDNKRQMFVWSDEFQIEDVISNYISNALNHIGGEKILKISVEKQGDVVRVTVANTGENIPEESIDRIWDKFYKIDKARTREYGGSGIGLSIVKAIMDSIHMKCGVNNTPIGVEFWFEVESGHDLSNK